MIEQAVITAFFHFEYFFWRMANKRLKLILCLTSVVWDANSEVLSKPLVHSKIKLQPSKFHSSVPKWKYLIDVNKLQFAKSLEEALGTTKLGKFAVEKWDTK